MRDVCRYRKAYRTENDSNQEISPYISSIITYLLNPSTKNLAAYTTTRSEVNPLVRTIQKARSVLPALIPAHDSPPEEIVQWLPQSKDTTPITECQEVRAVPFLPQYPLPPRRRGQNKPEDG